MKEFYVIKNIKTGKLMTNYCNLTDEVIYKDDVAPLIFVKEELENLYKTMVWNKNLKLIAVKIEELK